MRLALLHAFTWPEVRRGGERLVHDLAAALREDGHRVDVYTGTTGESVLHHGPDGRNYRLRIPWARPLARMGLSRVETFGARAIAPMLLHRYDAVHAFTPTAALAAALAGRPTLYTVLGHPDATAPPLDLPSRLLDAAIRRSAEVAALSTSAARAIAAASGRTPCVLPPGIRSKDWPARDRAPAGAPRVLFSADRSTADKGLDVLLAAFALVLDAHPDARLMLSGPGSPARALAGASERVVAAVDDLAVGDPEDLAPRYRQATLTVLPSRNEAFGIVLLESLASGTPVVACSPGGAQDVVADPGVGRLAAAGDVAGLAGAIVDTIALASDRDCPARCRAHAVRWDWERVLPAYLEAYRSLSGRASSAECGTPQPPVR